jgi:hypothetical protein
MAVLLRKPRFTRAWTFQEVLLSTRAVVICGTKRIVWTKFLIGIQKAQSISAKQESQRRNGNIFESIISLGTLWINLERPTGDTHHTYAQLAKRRDALIATVGLTEYAFVLIGFLVWVIKIDSPLWHYTSFKVIPPIGCILGILFGSFILFFQRRKSQPWIVGLAPEKLLPCILSNMRSRESSHPNDRIFAFYGVLKRADVFCQQCPDYSKPSPEAYRVFASDLLQNHKCLAILAYAELNGDQSLPSWVPNWAFGK